MLAGARGSLALLAGINVAIEATEATVDAPADMVAAGRAVVSDDGCLIMTLEERGAQAVEMAAKIRQRLADAGITIEHEPPKAEK